jgi:hypothetical protein
VVGVRKQVVVGGGENVEEPAVATELVGKIEGRDVPDRGGRRVD